MLFEHHRVGQELTFAKPKVWACAVEGVAATPSIDGMTTNPVRWVELVAVSGESFVERVEKSPDLLFIGSYQRVQHLSEELQNEFVITVLQPEAAIGKHPVLGPVFRVIDDAVGYHPAADLYLESVLGRASKS